MEAIARYSMKDLEYCVEDGVISVINEIAITSKDMKQKLFYELLDYAQVKGSRSPKELPLKALTDPYMKLSLHTALIIQPYAHARFQCARSLRFILLNRLTLFAACINVLSFLYLRFAQRLSFISKWKRTFAIMLRPHFP